MKKILAVLLALALVSGQGYCKKEADGATITCSSGKTGRCFGYAEAHRTIPQYDCRWTGRQSDSCTIVGIIIRLVRDWI